MYLYPNLIGNDHSNGHKVVTRQIFTKYITVKCFTISICQKIHFNTKRGDKPNNYEEKQRQKSGQK